MRKELIAELREWFSDGKMGGTAWHNKFYEILSRHEYAEFKIKQCHEAEQGEGLCDELEYILAQLDYQIATGSAFELELLQRFKLLVECAVARKNAIGAYWDKKAGKTTYEEMCEKIKEYGRREEQITNPTPTKAVEPLEVLADRKGFRGVVYDQSNDGAVGKKRYYCTPYKSHPDGGDNDFCAPTYALAEAKARAYLEALPDVKGGVV